MGKRLCYVIGTRPEVIRSAAIVRAFEACRALRLDLVNTGQHFDREMMADIAMEVGLPEPMITLQSRDEVSGRRFAAMIRDLVDLLAHGRFDGVLVYGDTDSSLAGALAGIKTGTPVVHIEAGCRSGDMRMQEEFNRRLIDHASALHLAVSEACAANLRNEATPGRVVVTGDPQFDVFWDHKPVDAHRNPLMQKGLVTLHRAENVDNSHFVNTVLQILSDIGKVTHTKFTWAAHPRTAKFLANSVVSPWVQITAPLSYRETLRQLAQSSVCITDSGGLQKEAFWLRTPCVTMRPSTEWVETLEAGANLLCPHPSELYEAVITVYTGLNQVRWDPDPYGGLGSSERVVDAIIQWLTN